MGTAGERYGGQLCIIIIFIIILVFHPIAGITWKNANIKDEFKGPNSTRIN